jgi:hypothetical protein
VSGQPIGADKQTTGCAQEGDHYRANGIKENNEAIIPGVKVKLGAGPCLAIGLAEAETLATDLSYSFTGLKPGTYCVSIDPLTEPSLSKLQNGSWTYPDRLWRHDPDHCEFGAVKTSLMSTSAGTISICHRPRQRPAPIAPRFWAM